MGRLLAGAEGDVHHTLALNCRGYLQCIRVATLSTAQVSWPGPRPRVILNIAAFVEALWP